jgi:hypothetical protein
VFGLELYYTVMSNRPFILKIGFLFLLAVSNSAKCLSSTPFRSACILIQRALKQVVKLTYAKTFIIFKLKFTASYMQLHQSFVA